MRAIKTQRVPTCVSELFVSLKVKRPCKRTTEGGLSPENTKETANLYSVRIKYRAATIKKKRKSQSKNMKIILKNLF